MRSNNMYCTYAHYLLNIDIVEDDILTGVGVVAEDDPWIGVQPSCGGDVVKGDIPHGDQRIGRANR